MGTKTHHKHWRAGKSAKWSLIWIFSIRCLAFELRNARLGDPGWETACHVRDRLPSSRDFV